MTQDLSPTEKVHFFVYEIDEFRGSQGISIGSIGENENATSLGEVAHVWPSSRIFRISYSVRSGKLVQNGHSISVGKGNQPACSLRRFVFPTERIRRDRHLLVRSRPQGVLVQLKESDLISIQSV